jgi:hypothetical protein
LSYVTFTEQADDGSGAQLDAAVTFTPTQTVYDSAGPVFAAVPVQAQIVGGQLSLLNNQPVTLLANDNSGLAVQGRTGFWLWEVEIGWDTPAGPVKDGWSFFLPSTPSTVDLFSTAGTGLPGGGMQNPMTTLGDLIDGGSAGTPQRLAGNTAATRKFLRSLGDGTSATAPAWDTLQASDVPQLADYAPTGLTGAVAASRYAGATASGAPASGTFAAGDYVVDQSGTIWLCVTAGTPGTWTFLIPGSGAAMAGWLAPKVVPLTDAATVLVNAKAGNDFRVQLGGNRTIGVPSNPVDGMRITIHVQQPGAGGPFTPTFAGGAGGYTFGSTGAPSWSTAASAVDITAWLYRADLNKWCYNGTAPGN